MVLSRKLVPKLDHPDYPCGRAQGLLSSGWNLFNQLSGFQGRPDSIGYRRDGQEATSIFFSRKNGAK